MTALRSLLLFFCFLSTTSFSQEQEVVAQDIILVGGRSPFAEAEGIQAGIFLRQTTQIYRTQGLCLVDGNNTKIPAHFEVLSRRAGLISDTSAPIDWIEVSFPLNTSSKFPFKIIQSKAPEGHIQVTQEKDVTTVLWNGHQLSFDRSKPALLRSIKKGSEDLLAAPALELFYTNEKEVEGQVSPWQFKIEKLSSLQFTFLVSTQVDGLIFEMRLRFISGAAEIAVDFRLVNPGPYGHMATKESHVWFDRLSLSLPRLVGSTTVSTSRNSYPAQGFALLQDHRAPYKKNQPAESSRFQIWADGAAKSQGVRHHGCFALGNSKRSFSYGFVDFWENAPKAWSVQESVVLCDIFPAGGSGPHFRGRYGLPNKGELDPKSKNNYRFEGARAKSHRLFMNISGQSPHEAAMRTRAITRKPLHVTVRPEAMAGRDLLGYLITPRSYSKSSDAQRFDRFSQLMVDDQAADNQPGLGKIGYPEFIARGGTYGRSVFYGWFNFGDIPWGDGYCSLHYDLPFSMLFQFLRSGDPRFLTLGQSMAKHRRDIDQDHDRDSPINRRGGQFYEKGWWHGNYYHPIESHTWVKGPLLHYLITGDLWSLEAALLNRDFIRRNHPDKWNGNWGTRIPGWNIDNLVALFEVLGHQEDLKMAKGTIARWQTLETKRHGKMGYLDNIQMKPVSWKPWMHNIFFNAVAMYRLKSNDKQFDPLLDRMAKRFRTAVLKKSPGGPWMAARNMVQGRRDRPSVQLLWPMAASFSLLGRIHKRPADIQLARSLFHDALVFFQGKQGSPLAFRIMQFPNSESKIHSGIQLWGLHALPHSLDP